MSLLQNIKEMISGGDKPEEADFYLLPDRPIAPDKKEDIRFGHHEIADTVFALLKRAEAPFTLGLYGKWGVGKTTISALVKLRAENDGMRCLFFDAWKYERDSLRRQFLIELDKQVFEGRLEYKSRLNQSLSSPENLTLLDYIKRILSSVVLRVAGVITLLLVAAYFAAIFYGQNLGTIALFNALAQVGLLGTIVSFMLSSFEVVRGTKESHRTDSAEGFEDHFSDALKENELAGKTLLVIVDNLDRVEDSKAVSILSDIKTFLSDDRTEQRRVLFLIPCDDQALRTQLEEIYGNEFDTDEFLRKFFNLTIKIPKFIDLDLFNYVRELLQKTAVKEYQDNPDLEGVIVFALRDNPREIKQFINSLIPKVLIARERKLEPVLQNVAFLAKLLVIQQKFPILYEILEERSLRAQISLDTSELDELLAKELRIRGWGDDENSREREKFRQFNIRTPGINEKIMDVFLTLRLSEEERKIPEWSSLTLALEEGRKDDAAKLIADLKAQSRLGVLDALLKSRVEKIKSGPAVTRLAATAISIFSELTEKSKYFFDAAANFFPYDQDFNKTHDEFDPKDVFDFWYPNTTQSRREKIVAPFVGLFGTSNGDGTPALDEDYARRLLTVMNAKPEIFSAHKGVLQGFFQNTYYRHPYLSVLTSEKARKEFVTATTAGKYVDSLGTDDFENTEDLKLALDFWRELTLDDGAEANSLKKYRELFNGYNSSEENEKLVLCAGLHEFSKKYSDMLNDESLGESHTLVVEMSELSTMLGNYYDSFSKTGRAEVIDLIDFYAAIAKNKNRAQLNSKIDDFISNADNETLDTFSKTRFKNWFPEHPRAILRRSQTDPKIFMEKEIYRHVTPEQNQTVATGLVGNRLNAEPLLKAIEYNVASKEATIDHIISHIPNFDVEGISELVKSLRGLGVDQYSDRIENLKNRLLEYMRQHSDHADEIKKLAKRNRGLFNPGQRIELFGKEDEPVGN